MEHICLHKGASAVGQPLSRAVSQHHMHQVATDVKPCIASKGRQSTWTTLFISCGRIMNWASRLHGSSVSILVSFPSLLSHSKRPVPSLLLPYAHE